jgi:hypothetical protein
MTSSPERDRITVLGIFLLVVGAQIWKTDCKFNEAFLFDVLPRLAVGAPMPSRMPRHFDRFIMSVSEARFPVPNAAVTS